MNIRLNILRLKNFKGIKDFALTTNGNNTNVYGDNGAGKTTLADSFLWLLFNKDSTDRTQFTIKPQDKDGNDIHNLQTEVEAELLIDDKPLKLRKILEEKWTKRRGSLEPEFTGHTIRYWWDDEPVKEQDYKDRMSRLIKEDLFRMITNPLYFNTKIKWEDRRKVLLAICGDKTDEEVIASDDALSKLKNILGDKSIEVYKNIVADKLRALKKQIDDIPPRIDELFLSLPEEQDYTAAETELEKHKAELADIEAKLSDAKEANNDFMEIQRVISILKLQLEDIISQIDAKHGADRNQLIIQRAELSSDKMMLETSISMLEEIIAQLQDSMKSNSGIRETLLDEWRTLSKEKADIITEEFIDPDQDNFICPTCGQALPEDAKEQKVAELRKNFEADKASRIAQADAKIKYNISRGLAVKDTLEKAQSSISGKKEEVSQKTERLSKLDARLAQIDADLSKPIAKTDYDSNAEYASLQKQIQILQAELNKPWENKADELLMRKAVIQLDVDKCNFILNGKITAEKTQKRIGELKAEEKKLAQQIAELEGHKYLMEQFSVAKVNLLEGDINSKFKHVRFKLFDQLISGGIVETCLALVNTNGKYVPFDDANHAGKVNAGIDCINALCKYYEVTAPIFIDFRESVSKIIPTESQIINLIKHEPDKKLRVEVTE